MEKRKIASMKRSRQQIVAKKLRKEILMKFFQRTAAIEYIIKKTSLFQSEFDIATPERRGQIKMISAEYKTILHLLGEKL